MEGPAGMIIQSKKPDPSLSHLIREYYFFTTGTRSSAKFVPVIDDGCYDFIFFREQDSTLVYGPAQHSLPITCKVFTIHQLKPPYRVRFGEVLTFFTIKVQPWANAHFFSTLTGSGVIDLSPVVPGIEAFHKEVFSGISMESRFEKADAFIKGQHNLLSETAQWVRGVAEAIYQKSGMTSVHELSLEFGVSRQYLNRVFKQHVFYSLKTFILIVRIMDLVKFKVKNPGMSMTELCFRYDYFDQPHFNRDFRRVCGVTPTEFFGNLPEFLLRH